MDIYYFSLKITTSKRHVVYAITQKTSRDYMLCIHKSGCRLTLLTVFAFAIRGMQCMQSLADKTVVFWHRHLWEMECAV
jgi:hypothetical protein